MKVMIAPEGRRPNSRETAGVDYVFQLAGPGRIVPIKSKNNEFRAPMTPETLVEHLAKLSAQEHRVETAQQQEPEGASDPGERVDLPPGHTRHHTTDGGWPGVGLEISLGNGASLWVGEISRDLWQEHGGRNMGLGNDFGWWVVHHPAKGESSILGRCPDEMYLQCDPVETLAGDIRAAVAGAKAMPPPEPQSPEPRPRPSVSDSRHALWAAVIQARVTSMTAELQAMEEEARATGVQFRPATYRDLAKKHGITAEQIKRLISGEDGL